MILSSRTPSDEVEPPTSDGRRRTFVRLAGVVVLVGIGLLLFFVFRQNGTDGETPSSNVPLSEEAKELTELTSKGRDLTYHAVYEVVATQPSNASLELQLWRKGGRIRQDQEIRAQGQVLRTSGFRLNESTISCVKDDDKPWTCQSVPETSDDGTRPSDPLLAAVAADLASKEVTAKDEEVGGRDARCFTIKDANQTSGVCITDEGIPVRISTGQSTLELTELEDEVEDGVFDPPADVTPPNASP